MQIFSNKRAMFLGVALTLAALGAQASYAQDTAAPAPVVDPAPATDPVPATEPVPAMPAEPAPAPVAAEPAPAAPAAAPTAPAVAVLNEIPAAPEGQARIVFFRPSRYVGMAVSFSVREGDTGIGKLTNGTYFVHFTDPGTKEYNISFEARDTLRMEVEEGETYYVIEGISMGVLAARPNLTPSSEEAFQTKKLKVTKATATNRNH